MIIICICTGLPELLSQQGQFLFFLIRTDKIPINDETCDWILDFLKGIYLQIMPVTSSPLSPTTVQLSAFDCQQLRRHRFLTPAAILTCLHVSGMSVKLWLNSLAGRPPRSTTSTPPWSPSSPHEQVSSFQWPWSGGMNLSCACMWRWGDSRSVRWTLTSFTSIISPLPSSELSRSNTWGISGQRHQQG